LKSSVLVTGVTTVVTSMTNNDNDTRPAPALTLITDAKNAFTAAIAAAADRGKQAIPHKDAKRCARPTI
jgi:hypothetical protein